ncbi:MAG: phenylalanine--tRNA ligase subunit alpha [Lachnospiraceae bacterium]|nr:phenylalanine--tRNA ligase subunit alpha [Lachnospiraceae bacterium]
MSDRLNAICREAAGKLQRAANRQELAEARREILGKHGALAQQMRALRELPEEERAAFGARVNREKRLLEESFACREAEMEEAELTARLAAETIDVTLPAAKIQDGHRHPITRIMEEIQNLFIGMGYEVVEGPEVEYDYYNFEALNIPDDHPLREEQDTFIINPNILLRTQTTPVEIRVMERQRPPICAIASGRVFRAQEAGATSSPNFHQIEGLVIDKNITFSDLKGTMAVFARNMLGSTRVKFRPYKYPYNEPSAKMDVACFHCGGRGCPVCGGEGWVEILGCGMIHPKVLSMSGIDPDIYSGFGFGLDVEQIAMLKWGIDDMRLLYENDESFLAQF